MSKMIVTGLLRNGYEHTEVLDEGTTFAELVRVANWWSILDIWRRHEDGSRKNYSFSPVEEANQQLAKLHHRTQGEAAPKTAPESPNARFDRIKREAHEARIVANLARRVAAAEFTMRDFAKLCFDLDLADQGIDASLDIAMRAPLSIDLPLRAGPRHGLEP